MLKKLPVLCSCVSQCSDTLLRNVYPDDITLVHQFLRRAKELCQNDKLEVVYSGTQEHLWRVLFTIRRLDEGEIPLRVDA